MTTTPKHTPGWAVDRTDKTIIIDGNGRIKCEVYGDGQAEREEHTSLIVRAVNSHDDLLAALQPVHGWADMYNPPDDPVVVIELTRAEYDALVAAIARATQKT